MPVSVKNLGSQPIFIEAGTNDRLEDFGLKVNGKLINPTRPTRWQAGRQWQKPAKTLGHLFGTWWKVI